MISKGVSSLLVIVIIVMWVTSKYMYAKVRGKRPGYYRNICILTTYFRSKLS